MMGEPDSSPRHEVPSSITSALLKQQERVYLLHLEKNLVNFIRNSILVSKVPVHNPCQGPSYTIHSIYLKNSYYRLLTHQLCQYYNLQHWNNQQNEIIVSATQNFDYAEFITHVDNPSSPNFTKLSVYIQMEMSLGMASPNGVSRSQKPQSHSLSSTSLNKSASSKQIKLIRKERNETSSSSLSDPADGADTSPNNGSNTNVVDITLNMEEMAVSDSPESAGSQDSKIESDRATKEALYMKIREKIFDQEDEAEGENNRDDNFGGVSGSSDENEEDEEDEGGESSSDERETSNRLQSGGQRNTFQEQNKNTYNGNNGQYYRNRSGKNHHQRYNHGQNHAMNAGGVNFLPAYPGITIPLQYSSTGIPTQSGTGVIPAPMVAMYPPAQQQAHIGNGAYFGLQFPPNGYYPGPVLIAPMGLPTAGNTTSGPTPTPGVPGGMPGTGVYLYPIQPGKGVRNEHGGAGAGGGGNEGYFGASGYGNRTSYDKETERKILNNPYIILPDSGVSRTKTRKRYNNNNNSGVGSSAKGSSK